MLYIHDQDQENIRTQEDVYRWRLKPAKTLLMEAGFADCVAILSTRDTERLLSSLRVELRHHPFQLLAVLYGHESGLSCLVKELKRQGD